MPAMVFPLRKRQKDSLAQISDSLQRIREIAVQAANDTVEDRSGLQSEVNQLTQEISRIVQNTEFNGTRLLSSGSTLKFQVGMDGTDNNQIEIAMTDLTAATTTPSSPPPGGAGLGSGSGQIFITVDVGAIIIFLFHAPIHESIIARTFLEFLHQSEH
ncbi:hypothetical protein [Thiogranum longum]|uniref:flagellin N-terminal helical domain-containing protein n=1 Tax=Thiogranum longum TaxID=1537524 RepID=UPI003C70C4BE